MTIRELNQQELNLVSGGYTPNPEGPIFIPIPRPKWPFPIPHPADPIIWDRFKNVVLPQF